MNISAPFINRPVATLLLTFAVLVLGAVAYQHLPIAALPAVDRPTIGVYAPMPGASADTVARALAQPLETKLGIIPGIVEMTSWSAMGGTQIILQFDLRKDIDAAAGEVMAAINAAGPNLPKAWGWPPRYYKANPAGFAVIALALTSDVIPASEIYEAADSVIGPKLSQLPGVAQVYITGAERRAVRVQVAPARVAAMNLSLETIRTAIVASSQNLPKGAITVGAQRYTIEANDQLLKAEEYREVIVAYRHGAPVRLGDIAEVTDSVINNKVAGWYGTGRGVVIYVYKRPDANVVETVDAVKAALPEIERWLPSAVKVNAVYDRTTLIRASIADVQWTIAIATGLVVLVIALFLKRFWATVIPSLTIPVSLAATLVVMVLCGYNLDNLSLLAITIAVGFVVDDAVIMIETIMRRIQDGQSPAEAALAGTRQLGFTVVSITAALVAALIPILFMPDVVGRYFREFGVTLVAAITASAVVSLTLTPMLCARLLGGRSVPTPEASPDRIQAWFGRVYERSLDWTLRHRAISLVLTLAVTLGTAWLYVVLPKGFMPTQDTGVMFVRTIANANISFAEMERRQRVVGEAILEDPAVSGILSYIGQGNGGSVSHGSMLVALKPVDERKIPIQQVIQRLRERLPATSDLRSFFAPLQDLNLGVQTGSRYHFSLWGTDIEQVIRAGNTMLGRMRKLPQIAEVFESWESNGLQAGLTIDRVKAASLGVTPLAIDATLYDAFAQAQIKTLYLPNNFSRVILEVNPEDQGGPTTINQLYVPSVHGGQVPMAELTRPVRAHAPLWIRHQAQFPAVTISFDVVPGVAIGQAIQAIQESQASAGLPDEVRTEFLGEAAAAAKSGPQRLLLFLGALVAVYIVLGVLYESYVHPLTILSTLPSTVFGALFALWAMKVQFTLITSIACILLVGMVMKNAIMMVDFAIDAERNRGLEPDAAIRLAARLRARPITMTMLAALLSAIPIAVGTGPGFELRQPLGIAMVGGLLVAQLFTLYTTPVFYLLMNRLSRRSRRLPRQTAAVTGD